MLWVSVAPYPAQHTCACHSQVISWFPRITYYPAFISPPDAEHIVALALKQMTRAWPGEGGMACVCLILLHGGSLCCASCPACGSSVR
jgi:hypothetical protein